MAWLSSQMRSSAFRFALSRTISGGAPPTLCGRTTKPPEPSPSAPLISRGRADVGAAAAAAASSSAVRSPISTG